MDSEKWGIMWLAISVMFIGLCIGLSLSYETRQAEQTTRKYIENGYQLTPIGKGMSARMSWQKIPTVDKGR